MKKLMLMMTGFLLAVLVLAGAGLAYAQTQTPPDGGIQVCPFCDQDGGNFTRRGPGMMWGFGDDGSYAGGHGMLGGFAAGSATEGGLGLMHDFMLAAFAEALNIDPTALEARLDAGETMWEIAEAQGLSAEDFQALMLAARTDALTQAVADGTITQEQADWMLSRWNSMLQSGYGPGTGNCQGGNAQGGRGNGRHGGRP